MPTHRRRCGSATAVGGRLFVPGKPPVTRANADLTGLAFEDDEAVPWAKGRWRATRLGTLKVIPGGGTFDFTNLGPRGVGD